MGGPSLIATLGANISQFVQDLETAKGHAKKSGEGIGSAFGEELEGKLKRIGSFVAIEEGIRRTIEWADSLADLSIRTGLSVEKLQELDHIGSKTGQSVQELASFYERLGKAMAVAHKGGAPGEEMTGGLGRLGVSSETLESGDMGRAMAEVAAHLQASGEITPQLEADMAKIFKNSREAIPALKAMSEDAQVFEQSIAVSTPHMAAMKALSDDIKDAWHLITSAGKSFVGEVAYGIETVLGNLKTIPRWFATLFETGSVEQANTAAIAHLRKIADDRAKLEKELSGQKPGKDPYAEVEDKGAEKAAKKRETEERALDEKRAKEADKIKSIHEQTAEIQRKSALEHLTATEKRAALEKEIAKLKNEVDPYGEANDLEIAERQKTIAERKAELAGIKDDQHKPREAKLAEFHGGVLGAYNASAPEAAMLNVQQKSQEHLARIDRGIATLVSKGNAGSLYDAFGDTEF